MTNSINASVFNLADLSDVPEELRTHLETEGRANAQKYAALVIGAGEAGLKSVNIRQIHIFAHRAYGEGNVPTVNTIRAYLNEAVKLGLIGKPTRASYSADTSVVVEGDDEAVEEVGTVATEVPDVQSGPAATEAVKEAEGTADADPLAALK